MTVDGNDGLLIKRKNTLPYRAGRLLVQESFKKLQRYSKNVTGSPKMLSKLRIK